MNKTETFLDQQRQNQTKNQAISHHEKGNQLYAEGRYKDAIEEFTTAISLQLSNVLYYFERARCYFVEKDYHKYVFDLSLAMHVENANYALYIARSYGLFLLGQYENARLDLISARTLFDDYAAQEKAEQQAALAAGQKPRHQPRTAPGVVYATIAFRRGTVNLALNKYQEAIEDFTECLGIQENFGPAYSRRGAAYLILKRVNEAIEDLKNACAKCGTNQHIHHYRLGQAYLQAQLNQLAVDQFSAAIDAANSNMLKEGQKKRGQVSKPPTETLYFCNQRFDVFKFEPPDVLKLTDTSQSFRDQQRTVFPEFSATRGKAKALLGKFQEALEDFQYSSQLDQNNAETYFEKSTANRIMGNYAQALADCEICATLMLNSNVAYNKAIILENSGQTDPALRIYEAILQGVFAQNFTPEYLRSKGGNVIDAVVNEGLANAPAGSLMGAGAAARVVDPHPPSLYHAALLHRQKLNFERALQLVAVAIEESPEDERLYDLQAMLYCDAHQYREAIEAATKSIELQINRPAGVFWDSYYIRAVCHARLREYNAALDDLVKAQNRPAGGMEKYMKRADQEKIIALLLKLPPGSPISIAYMNFNNVDAIPKDPLAPSSAARGHGSSQVFPILDLRGCLPGYHNQDVVYTKAQCLFQVGDYVGCVRALSLALEDFSADDTVRGERTITRAFELLRDAKPIRYNANPELDDGQIHEQVVDQPTIDYLLSTVTVPLTKSEKEHVHNLYFLRARALSMLNRFQHAVKDCERAKAVFEANGGSVADGSLLFFLAKLQAYLRLYTKSYHTARQALRSGLPYNYIHRAHYLMGVALVYGGRLELAAKCFSLALRSRFQAELSEKIHDRSGDGRGLIQLLSLEEIAAYLEQHENAAEEFGVKMTEQREVKVSQVEGSQAITSQSLSGGSHGNRQGQDIHRLPAPKCFPDPKEAAQNKSLEQQRLRLLERAFVDSDLNGLSFDNGPVMDLARLQTYRDDGRGAAAARLTVLQRISTAETWASPDTAFYLHERAKCLQELGLHRAAAEDFTAVLRFQPLNDRAYFRRGFSLKQLGEFEAAVADFRRARELRPDLQVYQIGYGQVGPVAHVQLAPPGNEEFYTGAEGEEFGGAGARDVSKLHQDAQAPVREAVERRRENRLGVVGAEEADVWELLADFGPVDVEV